MLTVRNKGFTLIELMIVVAIVAILAAIAYPSYSNYGFRARRSEGHDLAMRFAAAQERYYTRRNSYATVAQLGLGATSERGNYSLAVALANGNQTYTLTLSPVAGTPQAGDKCGNLTIDNAGSKGRSGNDNNGKCW